MSFVQRGVKEEIAEKIDQKQLILDMGQMCEDHFNKGLTF